MKKKTKFLTLFLVLLFVLSIFCVQSFTAKAYQDDQSHWAKEQISRYTSLGIINGYEDGTFKPDQKITRAEFVKIINRMLCFNEKSDMQFSDVKSDKWYADEILKARHAGYFEGLPNNISGAENNITRQDACVMVSRVFELEDSSNTASYNFKDYSDVAEYAKSHIFNLIKKNYIKGYPDGTFKPKAEITRAEAVAILDRIASYIYNKSGENTKTVSGNAIISTNDIILKNLNISGDLFISSSLNGGKITLQNSIIRGNIYILGNTHILSDKSVIEGNTFIKGKSKSVVLEGDYKKIKVASSNCKVKTTGNIESLEILPEATGTDISLDSGKIAELEVNGKDTVIDINDSVFVEKMIVNEKTTTSGEGTIESLIVNADDVVIAQNPESVDVYGNYTPEINGGKRKGNEKIYIKSITLDKTDIKLKVGQSEKLNAQIKPEKASKEKVIWKTSNENVAKVDEDGTVTAVNVGNCEITVQSLSNSNISAKCTITVYEETDNFTFDNDINGWYTSGGYTASYGKPEIEFSKDIGSGCLRLNAQITDESSNWQELRIATNLKKPIEKSSKISYEMYLDLSKIDLNKYGSKILKPYIVLDPGWIKIGEGVNTKTISNLEIVTNANKKFGRMKVVNTVPSGTNAAVLHIGFISENIVYSGPIYFDNIIVTAVDSDHEHPEPSVKPDNNQPKISTKDFNTDKIDIVDENATPQTRSLFSYLKNIGGKNLLFGHQHSTLEGVTISKNDGTQSDCFNSVGAFPAVYGFEPYESENAVTAIKKAYERGGIITLSYHMPNFYTGGNMYDTTPCVKYILPGTSYKNEKNDKYKNIETYHEIYKKCLDDLAEFANKLKDDKGNLIPVIFRPFHENNADWFWWCNPFCSKDEYIKLYRFTVEYLRDVKGIHNFLYEYSPHSFFNDSEDEYLKRYPGNDYVDILGYDAYDTTFTSEWMDKAVNDARLVSKMAEKRNKVSAIAEIGPKDNNTGVKVSGNQNINWFSDFLKKLKADPVARKVSYLLVWRNASLDHMWIPYRNHPIYGNSEMLDDFIRFYNDEYTAFNDRLEEVYDLDVNSENKKPSAYIAYPTQMQRVDSNFEVWVKTLTYENKVDEVLLIDKAGNEYIMEYADNGYYKANYSIDKTALDNNIMPIKVIVKFSGGKVIEDTIKVKTIDNEQTSDSAIIDDFEYYDGDSSLLTENYFISTNGDPISIKLSDNDPLSGKYSLEYTYSLAGSGYAGVSKYLAGIDWSNYEGIQFMLKPDNSKQKLCIQIKANDISFEYYIKLEGNKAKQYYIPFKDFTPAPWESTEHRTQKLDKQNLKNVRHFAIYVNAVNNQKIDNSTLIFDDIKATSAKSGLIDTVGAVFDRIKSFFGF